MSNIKEVTSASFVADVIESEVPVLVDFWAPWCGPCRALAPQLEQLAAQRPDLQVTKVNTDEHPELASQLGVAGVPTLVLFSGGAERARMAGAQPAARIASAVDTALS